MWSAYAQAQTSGSHVLTTGGVLVDVGEHHSLHRALGGDLERGVPALARRVPLPFLTLLARADSRGRTVQSDDARQGEDTAELLELAARSQPVAPAVLSAQLNSLDFPDMGEAHELCLHLPDGDVLKGEGIASD